MFRKKSTVKAKFISQIPTADVKLVLLTDMIFFMLQIIYEFLKLEYVGLKFRASYVVRTIDLENIGLEKMI